MSKEDKILIRILIDVISEIINTLGPYSHRAQGKKLDYWLSRNEIDLIKKFEENEKSGHI